VEGESIFSKTILKERLATPFEENGRFIWPFAIKFVSLQTNY
jgi:hypothetical protein